VMRIKVERPKRGFAHPRPASGVCAATASQGLAPVAGPSDGTNVILGDFNAWSPRDGREPPAPDPPFIATFIVPFIVPGPPPSGRRHPRQHGRPHSHRSSAALGQDQARTGRLIRMIPTATRAAATRMGRPTCSSSTSQPMNTPNTGVKNEKLATDPAGYTVKSHSQNI
jgi:hypothetical protein